jgi:hypothetical protein
MKSTCEFSPCTCILLSNIKKKEGGLFLLLISQRNYMPGIESIVIDETFLPNFG